MNKQNNDVKKIVIAGGGTAGWMTAAGIAKTLGKNLDITLVESDEIATVGVGEATIPTLQYFHQVLDINEAEFIKETHGTFKLGINFENWRNVNEDYFHAFGVTGKDCWAAGFQHFWLKGKELGIASDFGDYCFERVCAVNNKFAQLPNNGLNYAYHIDATRYGQYLRKLSEKHGAKRIEGKINKVNLDPQSGEIRSLSLTNGKVIEGDLFIDCTGQRALLIEGALHTGYEDWSHWLPCNSAIAMQTESVADAVPYTRSIAHEWGWQWQIPLQHRMGNGVVYSDRFVSDDEAQSKLEQNVPGKPINSPRVIRFKTGSRRKHWNKNCIAVGLSSGFLEPLESTSIHLIQRSILRLLRIFPQGKISQLDIDEFNQQAQFDTETVRDFIILHYKVTNRDDSDFWRHCRQMEIPEGLAKRIQLFKESGRLFRVNNELFDDSWMQVMIGQGLIPESYHPIVDNMSKDELNRFLTHTKNTHVDILKQLPTHAQFLKQYYI